MVPAIACGVGFGVVAVLLMMPMSFPNKRTALIGLLISLPDAIVTKAYAPILIVGVAGGALIGWLVP